MKRSFGLVLVLVAVIAAYFVWARTDEVAAPETAGEAPAAVADAEIARERLEARARGEIDVSPCSASGRVLDRESGRGIAGAQVLLRARGFASPTGPDEAGAPLTTITDAGGAWSIERLVPGRYVLTASAPEHLPAARSDLSLRAGHPNVDLDLALERGGHPLRGTVSDVSGGPVEGAVITIEGEGQGNLIDFSRTGYPAVADAEGRFEVQVRDGVYQVSAWHPDYTGDSETADVEGAARSVALRLTPAATIEGVVRALGTGAAVEGAIVSDGEMGGLGGDTARTDASGRFRLTRMRPGVHKLSAAAAGHASTEPVKLELGLGQALTGVVIEVDRAFKISGFVVPRDDPKRSLEGVMVAAYSLSPMQVQVATGPSGVDGFFEVYGVKPGSYTLGSVAEQALPEILGGPAVTIVDEDITGVVIQLDRGVELRGRVEPAALAAISLTLADDEPGIFGVLGNLGNMFVRSRADGRGEFTLRPVKPGKLRVVAQAPDGSRGQVDVEVGERGLADVVVALEPRATATGRVVDARGAALSSGSVEYQPRKRKPGGMMSFAFNARSSERAPIGEDGGYTLRGLDGGEYDVRVLDRAGNVVRWAEAAPKYAPARRSIAAAVLNSGLDYTVELRDGVLRGVVLDPDGGPIADAWVTAAPEQQDDAESRFHRPEEDRPAERVGVVPEPPAAPKPDDDGDVGLSVGRGEPALTGEDGRFELTGLARRKYTLRVEALAGSARARQGGIAVGSEVRLQVAPLAELAGSVRVGGKPVARCELQVERKYAAGGYSRSSETVQRPDGAFHLDHLDPGAYRLIATADEGRAEVELELKAGERAQRVLELQPWGRLRGVVIDGRTGAPIAGMSLAARSGDSLQTGAAFDMLLGRGPRTDATGRFEVPRVAGGKGTLQIFDGDVAAQRVVAEVPFEIEAGADRDLGTIRGITPAKVPKPERGQLGMRLLVASEPRRPRPPGTEVEPLAKQEDEAAPRHLYVLAVTIDGPADRAGVQPGDELVTIDGASTASVGIENAERLLSAGSVRAGQHFALELERDGGRQTASIDAVALEP